MFQVSYATGGAVGQCHAVYAYQHEAVYVAAQLAQLGHTATVAGPGGVHTTFYPYPPRGAVNVQVNLPRH